MQGPVRSHHRKSFRRSPTLRTARARRQRPKTRRTAHGPHRRGANVPRPDSLRGTGGADAVNYPTPRGTTPATDPRTGRVAIALPHPDPGAKTQSLPFSALPHELRKDPRLKRHRTAVVLAAAL